MYCASVIGGYRVKREGNGFRICSMVCLVLATGSMSILIRFEIIFGRILYSISVILAFLLLIICVLCTFILQVAKEVDAILVEQGNIRAQYL